MPRKLEPLLPQRHPALFLFGPIGPLDRLLPRLSSQKCRLAEHTCTDPPSIERPPVPAQLPAPTSPRTTAIPPPDSDDFGDPKKPSRSPPPELSPRLPLAKRAILGRRDRILTNSPAKLFCLDSGHTKLLR